MYIIALWSCWIVYLISFKGGRPESFTLRLFPYMTIRLIYGKIWHLSTYMFSPILLWWLWQICRNVELPLFLQCNFDTLLHGAPWIWLASAQPLPHSPVKPVLPPGSEPPSQNRLRFILPLAATQNHRSPDNKNKKQTRPVEKLMSKPSFLFIFFVAHYLVKSERSLRALMTENQRQSRVKTPWLVCFDTRECGDGQPAGDIPGGVRNIYSLQISKDHGCPQSFTGYFVVHSGSWEIPWKICLCLVKNSLDNLTKLLQSVWPSLLSTRALANG